VTSVTPHSDHDALADVDSAVTIEEAADSDARTVADS
jgi:hypothetical protein